MISLLRSLGRKSLALPAVLIVCLLPAAVHAETITIKNTTNMKVVVQASYVNARGLLMRGPIYTLVPGASTPGIVLPGNKIINFYDVNNPNKAHQHGIRGGNVDLNFDIVIDMTNPQRPRMKLDPKP